jgi:short-subunit dehydrogenase
MKKKAIIIGASSGIGEAIAMTLIRDGYKVGITGRRLEKLQSIRERDPENILICSFDITDTEGSVKCIDMLLKDLGGIDLFIYCSGRGATNEDLCFLIDYKVINVNIIGFTNAVTHVFKYMQKQRHGHIVNISSVAGLRGNHCHAAYHASKSYQCIYMEGLRKKSFKRKLNIDVTDIRPGFVQTDFISKRPPILVCPLEKAVRQMYRAIKNKRKVVYVSKRYMILAFLMKVFPCCWYDRCP